MEKHKKNSSPLLTVLKVIMLILTAIFPLMMVILSGAGVVYNSASYGSELTATGVLLIVSGVLMTLGAVLCLSRRTVPNLVSLFCSAGGLALCLTMLYKLADHADRAGWSDKYMNPIGDMYRARITPSIAPVAIAAVIALIQLLSYEAAEERRVRRERRRAQEEQSAPPIIED